MTGGAARSETTRQWVHIGSGAFALLLRVLTWPVAATLAAAAFAFNLLILPRIGRSLYRPEDHVRGRPLGIVLYPVMVLLLIVIFRQRLDVAAAAWAILAFGDGFATLVGRAAGTASWPWNRRKTVAGSTAFFVAAAIGGVALACWTRPAVSPLPSLTFAIVAPVVAALAAALIETLPIRLDDNMSVSLAAAAVLAWSSLMTREAFASATDRLAGALPWAIGVNVLFAAAGYRMRSVSMSGAIGGAVIGTIVYTTAGARGWIMLFATFLAAAISSRLGLNRKSRLGIAEEHGGRRGVGNALANCGVATAAGVLMVSSARPVEAGIVFVAALTAGGSDTVASEIGKAWGRATFLPTTLRRVGPGTPGAMSLEGTAAGVGAAAVLAVLGVSLGLAPALAIAPIVVGAVGGALVESVLAATLEGPGVLNNDVLNAINTAVAGAIAVALV